MATKCTGQLKSQLDALNESCELFASTFHAWKAQGAAGEFDSYLFGKDGAYVKPTVDGNPYLLRHVHLVPLKDIEKKSLWDKLWMRRSRRTSDRVLVYASGSSVDHLLIYILEEPEAHAIAEMRTPEDKALMARFAQVAAAFLFDGTVL